MATQKELIYDVVGRLILTIWLEKEMSEGRSGAARPQFYISGRVD
jgi:hypothetical protein